jgi:hypothetical protein
MPPHPATAEDPLDITQDLSFQVRMRRFQCALQILLVAVVVGALAGLFGNGPLSGREVRDAKGRLSVRFDRFGRFDAPQVIEVEAAMDPAGGERFFLQTSREFFGAVTIESITPQPERQSVGPGMVRYEIGRNDAGGRMLITIRYRPAVMGWIGASIEAGGGRVAFEQFVYP